MTCCNHNCQEGCACPERNKYHGLRYARTLAEAFPDVRAYAGVRYVRPGVLAQLTRWLRGLLRG